MKVTKKPILVSSLYYFQTGIISTCIKIDSCDAHSFRIILIFIKGIASHTEPVTKIKGILLLYRTYILQMFFFKFGVDT